MCIAPSFVSPFWKAGCSSAVSLFRVSICKSMTGFDADKLRSTRTRIAKVRNSSTKKGGVAAETSGVEDGIDNAKIRDWSSGISKGKFGRMRVIFVGHNPSDQSWNKCAPYAHRSNSFWKLLRESKLAPPELCEAQLFVEYPEKLGYGFADLFVTPGSLSSAIRAPKDTNWRVNEFCPRIVAATGGQAPKILACVSKTVAEKLLFGWKGDYGPVGTGADWKLVGLEESSVWVLPSSSGRAGIKWEDRLAPFKRLSEFVETNMKWPPTLASNREADDAIADATSPSADQ